MDLPLVHDFAANKVRVSRAAVLQPVHEQLALWRFVPMTQGEFLISNVDGLENDLLSGYGHIKCKHTDDIEDKTVRWRFRRCHDFNLECDAQGVAWVDASSYGGAVGGSARAVPAPVVPAPAPAVPFVRAEAAHIPLVRPAAAPAPAPPVLERQRLADGVYQIECRRNMYPLAVPEGGGGSSQRSRGCVLTCAPAARRADRDLAIYRFRLEYDARHDCHRIFAVRQGLEVARYEMPVFFDTNSNRVRANTSTTAMRDGNDVLARWHLMHTNGCEYLIANIALGVEGTVYLNGSSNVELKNRPKVSGNVWRFRKCHPNPERHDRDADGQRWS